MKISKKITHFISLLKKNRRGSALLVSTITVVVSSLAVVGVAVIVMDSADASKNMERSMVAFHTADALTEVAAFDRYVHGAGYEVDENSGDYNVIEFSGGAGSAKWMLQDRAYIFPSGDYNGWMVYPSPGFGNSAVSSDWNTLRDKKTIPLYVDATSLTTDEATAGGT